MPYNEGIDLIMQVERYRKLHGHYPNVVLVDKIYLNRENRRWLKEHGISHTGDPLGRKRVVNPPSAYQKKKRSECAERNQIEGRFGLGKRDYNLNNIKARLSSTSTSWIVAIIFVMNILRHMKGFLYLFFCNAFR
jgi:IS5 family transposase